MKMELWTVYKHTSPSNKVYIGITKQKPEYRWRGGKGYRTNKHFYNAICKYGWDNFKHEILYEGLTQEEAETIEKALVLELGSTDKMRGYNVAEGGHALTEESRRKISKTRLSKGVKAWNSGKHWPEDVRKKISTASKGNHRHTIWTEEQKDHMRRIKLGENNPNYGKPMNEKLKAKLIEINKKPVVQITENGEIKYASAKDAGDATGITNSNITRVCKGQRDTAGGFRWKYAEEG